MKNRFYGEKVDIDSDNTISFYDQRARSINSRKREYTTVLLGDQDPDYSVRWDRYEKEFIIPKLMIDINKDILDLGCGIGRWADAVKDKCRSYCGIDFSSEMISVAKQKNENEKCTFYNMSVIDALHDKRIITKHYDVIIMTGVAMYINDDELKTCYRRLRGIVDCHTLIYFEESVGKEQRLTLNHIWSENLNDYYGAIYRTRAEYTELIEENMKPIVVEEDGFMDILDKKEQSETSHWYSLFRCEGV